MRYVVVGAGAVGGTVAGLLADAGRDVAVVARGAHGEAIRERGLEVRTAGRTVRARVPVAATVAEAGLRRGDAVLLAVKSQHTGALLEQLGGLEVDGERAGDVLPVLHLQNGVANEDAALRLFAAVHGVCVVLPASHLEPGVVISEGADVPGVLLLGRVPGGSDEVDRAAAADLRAAGFDAEPVPDVLAWKRAKLLRNLGNALEALCGPDLDAAGERLVGELAERASAEGRAALAAAGLEVVDDEAWHARLRGGVRRARVGDHERQGGSTWQSVARGSGSVETDALNGEIVRLGRLTGIPTPVNSGLQRAVWRLLRDGAAPGSRSPGSLAAALRDPPAPAVGGFSTGGR